MDRYVRFPHRYRQEEADELVKEKAHAEKRMGTLLKLKQDINSNRVSYLYVFRAVRRVQIWHGKPSQ